MPRGHEWAVGHPQLLLDRASAEAGLQVRTPVSGHGVRACLQRCRPAAALHPVLPFTHCLTAKAHRTPRKQLTASKCAGDTPLLCRRPLQFEDVWELPPYDRVPAVHKVFDKHWSDQKPKGKPSLARPCSVLSNHVQSHWPCSQQLLSSAQPAQGAPGAAAGQASYLHCCVQILTLWRTNKYLFLTALPFKLVNDGATFVGPLFLSLLLGVVASGGSALKGYLYATLMLAGLLAGTLADNQHFQRVMRAGGLLVTGQTRLAGASVSAGRSRQ